MSRRRCRAALVRSVTLAACLAVASAVGLVAIGGVAAAKGSSTSHVAIGLICSCSGAMASSYAGTPQTYRAWADEVNAHGGIDGHHVKVIVKQDNLNPGTALSEAKQLVQQDHVVALVDSSTEDTAWVSYAAQQKVPVVGGNAQSDVVLTSPDVYWAGETIDGFFTSYAAAAKKVGAKVIGNFYCAESPSCAQSVPLLKTDAKAVGERVGYVTQISGSQPSYTAQCLAAKQAGVDALLVGEAEAADRVVAQDCAAQGYFPYYIEGDGAIAKSFTTTPGFDKHFMGFEQDVPFFLDSTPGTKLMNKSLKKYAPGVKRSPFYGEQNTQIWVSGLLFEAAAKAAHAGKHGAITSAEIVRGLHSLHNDTLGGMAPPLSYKAGKPNSEACWYWVTIKKGKFVAPHGAHPTCPSANA